MQRTRHEQALVKVNAEVDVGIAPLVLALARWPGVCTVDSCEGALGEASVCLCLPTKEEGLDFAFRILGRLVERHWEPHARVELSITTEDGSPSIMFRVPTDAVSRYAELLDAAHHREFTNEGTGE